MVPSFDHGVVVVGDVMLDRFVYGTAGRLSPEAPVPVVRKRRETVMAGGAGNVARNIEALGGRPTLFGLAGQDAAGDELARVIGAPARLVRSADWQTIVKLRVIAQHQQVVRIDEEEPRAATSAEASELLADLAPSLGRARAMILSDYGKGVLTPEVCARAITTAHEAGVLCIVDPKGRDYTRYAGAHYVTPNASELAEVTGMPTGTDAEVEAAARALLARVSIGAVIATRSEKGMMLIPRDGAVIASPATAQEVFDVSGAGDTVIATLALALAAGRPVAEAMQLANLAAGIVVAKLGTAVCSFAELEHAMRVETGGNGVLSQAAAARILHEWQSEGLRVGFANGCFDILHAGHVKLLREARRHCDRLIVALNDDASVARLKGPTRPINSLADRAAVIAGLDSVDAVTWFGEDTPLELILKLRPDRLFKGSDYTVDQVVGAREIRAWDGQTILLDLLPGRSTTSIVMRAGSSAQA